MKKIFISLAFLSICLAVAQKQNTILIVGTYTNSCDSRGIYTYEFNNISGECTLKSNTELSINPSYISLSKDKKTLFAVNENAEKSTISSFDFNSKSGKVLQKSVINAEGTDPCYIINDHKNVITANYSSGNIAVFSKNLHGNLLAIKQNIKHLGNSINLKRQKSSHLHVVQFSKDKKYLLATDLGSDKIYVYNYFPNKIKNVLVLKNVIEVKKGSGPRHLTISMDGKFVYVLQELSGDISVYKFLNGLLTLQSTASILEKDYNDEPRAADIQISTDNKFLYASNRETANDITVFKILPSGNLEYLARTSTLGNGPRNFVIDPTGNYLLVGNQKSNEIVVFKRDKTTGLLSDTGKRVSICAPVCLIF